MPSPFKFLDFYTREDYDQFFGREKETKDLHDLVNKNRLVLIYGPLGTGKTSLIQCGLGNRFESTDWLPIYIRRGNYLPTSIQETLIEYWEKELQQNYWEFDHNPLPNIMEDIFTDWLRPIYLVFDQLEEIFILGDETEQEIFTKTITDIYNSKVPCRLLFVIREEYLAQLYKFEPHIPTLFKRRLRVEPMIDSKAMEVISSSCKRFKIKLEDPLNIPRKIVEAISTDHHGVVLAYLQVYMDKLYREDFARDYGDFDPDNDEYDPQNYPLEFTVEEIKKMGEIGDVLKTFLREQIEKIETDLQQDFEELPPRMIHKVLNSFVSVDGTKRPRLKKKITISYKKDGKPIYLERSQVDKILNRLQEARILREEGGILELAHDTLSEEIATLRTSNEQALLEVTEIVKKNYSFYRRNYNRSEVTNLNALHATEVLYLNDKELRLIENQEEHLLEEEKLSAEEWSYVQASKNEANYRKKRRNYLYLAICVILGIFLVIAVVQWRKADNEKIKAQHERSKADSLRAIADSTKLNTLVTSVDYTNAFLKLEKYYAYNENKEEIALLERRFDSLRLALNQHRLQMIQQNIKQEKDSIDFIKNQKGTPDSTKLHKLLRAEDSIEIICDTLQNQLKSAQNN